MGLLLQFRMKAISNFFLILTIFLLGVSSTYAGHHPPPPNNGKKPPPPPGLSIEVDVYLILILAIILGIYIIYKYQLKAKTPI